MKEPVKYPRIRQLRKTYRLTQEDLAEVLHTSRRNYSYYETGDQNIPVESLCTLADFYGVSVDYLVGRSDRKDSEVKSTENFPPVRIPAMIVSEKRAILRAAKKSNA